MYFEVMPHMVMPCMMESVGGKQFELQKIAINSSSVLLRLSSSWSVHYRKFHCMQYCA